MMLDLSQIQAIISAAAVSATETVTVYVYRASQPSRADHAMLVTESERHAFFTRTPHKPEADKATSHLSLTKSSGSE